MTAGQLTEFQKQCRESIGGMLHDLGLAVTYKLVEGLQRKLPHRPGGAHPKRNIHIR